MEEGFSPPQRRHNQCNTALNAWYHVFVNTEDYLQSVATLSLQQKYQQECHTFRVSDIILKISFLVVMLKIISHSTFFSGMGITVIQLCFMS